MMSKRAVSYSRGTSKFDNRPAQKTVSSFDEFQEVILADRSGEKHKTYICGPLGFGMHKNSKFVGSDSWRNAELTLDRVFLAFDCDGFSAPEVFETLKTILKTWRGFGYTTASHEPDHPRCRFILSLSRSINRDEGIRLGKLFEDIINVELVFEGGGQITFDASVYRAEQPIYTPLFNSDIFTFYGEPLNVDTVISKMPSPAIVQSESISYDFMERKQTADCINEILCEQNYHDNLVMLAARLQSGGLAKKQIFEFLLGVLKATSDRSDRWVARCEELPNIIDSAFIKFPKLQGTFKIVSSEEFLRGEQPKWLIKNFLPAAGLGMIVGPSGVGKSFFTLDIALCLAHSLPWRDLRTREKARVVYIAAEGAYGLRNRLQAWLKEKSFPNSPLDWVEAAPNLAGDLDVDDLINAISQKGGVDLVVIDTLARVTSGADENSGLDMGKFLENCARLQKAAGGFVLLIHHTGKEIAKGARGWSGLKAPLDVEITIKIQDGVKCAVVTKLKDGYQDKTFCFDLKNIVLRMDDDGDFVESCVVDHVLNYSAPPRRPISKWQTEIFRILDQHENGLLRGELITKVVECFSKTGERDTRKSSAERSLDKLIDEAWVVSRDNRVLLQDRKMAQIEFCSAASNAPDVQQTQHLPLGGAVATADCLI